MCKFNLTFFNDKMANMLFTAEAVRKKLCRNDNDKCVRFMVFEALGKGNVPIALFPHQVDDALKIIATAKTEQGLPAWKFLKNYV